MAGVKVGCPVLCYPNTQFCQFTNLALAMVSDDRYASVDKKEKISSSCS